MSETLYFLDDYSDEVVPCECTLEGWAEWLSKPSEEWRRDAAAADGDRFRASVMRFADDVLAEWTPDGWELSREEPTADLIAVRFGPGLGWSADAIVGCWESLREFLAEEAGGSTEEHIAIGFLEPSVMLVYRSDPPRLIVEGAVQ